MINKTTTKPARTSGIRIKSHVKAGGTQMQHNQAVKGLRIKSHVKAGGMSMQHNQAAKGLRVKSGVKAGGIKLTDILVSG